LEHLCRNVEGTAQRLADLSIALPLKKVIRLAYIASLGLERVGERNFKRECDKVVESWAALKGHASSDRRALLSLSDQQFVGQYLLNVSASEMGYVGQYWQEVTHGALTLLSDEAVASARETIAELRQYVRYPLDRPRPGVPALSVDEFLRAAQLLAQLEMTPARKEAETLGAGQALGVSPWSGEIERLRTRGLGRETDWMMKSQALLPALGGNGPGSCAIELLSTGEHAKNRSTYPGAHWHWSLISVARGETRSEKRFRTVQAATVPLETIRLPGEPFEIRLYRHFSDRVPDAVISGTSPWAFLELMHQYRTVAASEDGKSRDVELVVESRKLKRYSLWIRLVFGDVMPAEKDWPVLDRDGGGLP
jgi:hypothetical protein